MSDYPDEQAPMTRPRRHRPSGRVRDSEPEAKTSALTEEFLGVAAAYGNTLLFVGYEVEGFVEITVYPRYRFSSDDRVQGHLGYVYVPLGTDWGEILPQVDQVYDEAQRNYRVAVSLRATEQRSHGSRFDSAYEAITDAFRESWHGFSLRLRREGHAQKDGLEFKGKPPEPVLVSWRGESFTVHVFPTGSITMARGDKRQHLLPAPVTNAPSA